MRGVADHCRADFVRVFGLPRVPRVVAITPGVVGLVVATGSAFCRLLRGIGNRFCRGSRRAGGFFWE